MKKNVIKKEIVLSGLKCELDHENLLAICQQEMEEDNYYDFDLFFYVINKAIQKEIEFEYFISWCVLVCNCLNYLPDLKYRRRIPKIYSDISDLFDSASFMDEYSKRNLLFYIARFRFLNFLLQNAVNNKKEYFLTEGVMRMLCFDHVNWTDDSSVYVIIIADFKTKKFDKKFIDDKDFIYDPLINYTFVDEEECYSFFVKTFYNEKDPWTEDHTLDFR